MAYNQPYMVLPIKNYYPTPSTLFLIQFHTGSNQPIWPCQTVTHKSETHPNNKVPDSLQTGFWIIPCMSFDVTLPFSTASSTCNTSYWILVSHHSDDVIIVSSCSPLDTKLGDEFTQPPTEQVLQLIRENNIKTQTYKAQNTNNFHLMKMQAVQEDLKLHQSKPAYCSAQLMSHKHVW